ncbi:MAG: pantoate--beta-alanine ligase [Anaerosomatales bacterium]|nr:pantoate--beta-alanine ligase [Anaerosomatales bacterium]MDT8434283.1 pantoate--beta-alanine ligase [Anaerosomatales bacterium]
MERVASKDEARRAAAEARAEGKTIALVPTMGALHEGHLSLVRAACERADYVVVSVFVNPTQFGPGEDFETYPRDLDADLQLLAAEGVDLVFVPSAAVMYAPDASVTVDPGSLASRWEGEIRPGHFVGVATVVTKLLSIVRPDLAYFGEKDYQQLQVVCALVRDLDLGVGVVGRPIVRDRDGLALSSRNARLSPSQRQAALAIPAALEAAAQALAWGEREARALERAMFEHLAGVEGLSLDYAVVVDPDTLEPLEQVQRSARALVAARIGDIHLIDNCGLEPPATPASEGATTRE